MRQRYLATILILLLLLIAGCGSVTSTEIPMGDVVTAIDPKDWEGTWLMYGPWNVGVLSFQVRVTDADNGVLDVATVLYHSNAAPVFKSFRLYLRHRQSDYWLWSLKASDASDDAAQPGYFWGLAARRLGSERAVLWAPRENAFADLVDQGILQGEVSGTDVLLENFTEKQWELMEAEDSVLTQHAHEPKLSLFYWEAPLVFIRAARDPW